ncbi:MAG: hypothetical protein UIQ67_06710 [Bacteroidales bacterium]|nr:hypothetical protein [Bacteroidales bacterium]
MNKSCNTINLCILNKSSTKGGSIQIRALCMEPSSNALDYS